MQLKGIYFFETCVPVVQWTTILSIIIIEILLLLKSKQNNITDAFLHANFEQNEKLFVKMPKGFNQYERNLKRRVIHLKNILYVIFNTPRYYCKYLTHKLIASGILCSNLDHFLFIGDKVICIVNVDNLIFWVNY